MSKGQLERLKTSIEKYGFIVPIITNKDLLIADGEQRLTVAKQLGMKEVSVIRLPVEDVDRRLLRQVLNKLRGEHELIADALEFEKIIQMGHEEDLKHLLDLSDSQLERYLAEIHEPKPEDYEIPEIDKITTYIQRGDIYVLGKHRLMCGDATSKTDVEALMNGNKADMVFTDPPYGINYDGSYRGKEWGKIEGDESISTLKNALPFILEAIKYPQSIYICSSSRLAHKFIEALENLGVYMATPIIWVKNRIAISWERYHPQHEEILFCGDGAHPTGKKSVWFGSKNETTVWDLPLEPNWTYKHPTQKPVRLPKRAIMNSSQPNNIILDVFGGSGSTLIACEQTNRTCYMMEIDPRYCQIIINRWEAYTKQKAQKLVKNGENNVSTTSD